MMDHQRTRVVEIISSEINTHGLVRLNQLTLLLEKRGSEYGIDRSIYGNQGPKRWLESNFSEFRVDGNNGKEIILFSTDENFFDSSSFAIEEERLNYSAESPYRIGVVNFCNNKNAFINQEYGKSKTASEDLSVIFKPELTRTMPEIIEFDTKAYVYLVRYAVFGTVKNTKTGLDHPAFDYRVPLKLIRTIPRKQCAYIKITSEEVILGHVVAAKQSKQEDRTTLNSSLSAIDVFLRKELSENTYVLSASFPSIAKKCGLPDFRNYADNVALFLKKYLPQYELKKNITLQGKLYPGVIILKDQALIEMEDIDDNPVDIADVTSSKDSFAVLDELFEAGRYVDFLAADIMKNVQPQELPLEYMEKAVTCAHRLLYPDSLESIQLNTFQQELLTNPTTAAFIKKWKNNGVFPESIIEQCGDTAIAHFDVPEHNALIVKLLNAIGSSKTLNNNYVGITARFVACENVLIPHFYIIRAFVQDSKTSIQKVVSEYCQIIKDLRHSTSGSRMPDDLRMYAFQDVLKIIHNNIFDCSLLDQNIRTNIVSVFVEYDKMSALKDVIFLWDTEHTTVEWRLVDLYFNLDKWTEQGFEQLINDGVNRQLLQRCLALLWRESYHDNGLNENYLILLSWVILHDDYTSIDEIVRYPSGKGLSRIDKQNMLIHSLATACTCSADDDNMYALASYIIFVIQTYTDPDDVTAETRETLDDWNKFSSDFYIKKTQQFGIITSETESGYVNLFAIFQMDIPNYFKLQAHYAEWFIQTYPPASLSAENFDTVFEELYNKGAYSALVEYYSANVGLEHEAIRNKHTHQYIESLIYLHRYADAIAFLWNSQSLVVSDRNALLVRAVGENFRKNGISPKAIACIGDASMRNETIKLLLAELKATQPLIINSLIALYVHEKKYINAAYLFTIFGSKADRGFVRLYNQIRRQLGRYVDFNKCRSHYHVIAWAFQTLNADDLVGFLNWANGIVIPNYKGHTEGHVFGFFYNILVENARNKNTWLSFLNHLLKNGLERNAWNICVCETVLRQVLQYQGCYYSQSALDYILNSANPALYPPNFLSYAFEIIKDCQSESLCRRLADALGNKNLHRHIIIDNHWLKTYEEGIKSFKHYCQNAYGTSGNPVYREILPLLGTELSVFELKELAQTTTSKQALFARICSNYLNDCDVSETMEVLFSDDWNGMSESELEVLNILRMIYADDDILLLDEQGLFDDEYSVRRFKRDCAEIISTYPEKTGLFAFDRSCNNESYKMLVYSYIFDVSYDQDLYASLDKRFTDFSDVRTYKVYLRLLSCAYKAQSIRNTTFPFFYKKWRYLKLYLALVLRYSTKEDDADILSLMEKNGHYDEVYADSYAPFVETVKMFMELDGISQEFKEHFLFSVMVSSAEDLYDTHGQTLLEMPAHHKSVCRKLIASLDYRHFNTSLFKYLWEDMKTGDFSCALAIATSISDYAFDTLKALQDNFSPSTVSKFEQLAFMNKPAQTLNEIVAMDISEIMEHHNWMVPLLCSRQFVFWINGRFRVLVIAQRDHLLCEKYKYISDYLTPKGISRGIYCYLCALHACIKNDVEQARSIVNNMDFCTLVPKEWTKEAEQIVQYANGTIERFKPDKVILDGSQESVEQNMNLTFVGRLLTSVFDEEDSSSTMPDAIALYSDYLKSDDLWDKSRLGLELLLWRANSHNSDAGLPIPPFNDLALEVGLGLLRPSEVNLTTEHRMLVATELYNNRSVYGNRKYSGQLESLKSVISTLINNGFALSLWVKYAAIIEEFLRETNAVMDFVELRSRILNRCAELASPNIGYDKKYEEYVSLLNAFSGLTSTYSMSIMRAIKEELEKLANGIRLVIQIEKPKTTNNCVYFQIKNVGSRTVSFDSGALSIVLQQEGQPNATDIRVQHIQELQSGSMTGGSARLVVSSSDQQVAVKLMVICTTQNDLKEVVCSTEEVISIAPPRQPDVPTTALTAARQSVSSAVTDDELLFGREDKKELLAQSIPTGVTLIYGPSRIGKTSLINWIRNKYAIDRGNVLTILIGGENGLGKDSDYNQNMIDRTKSVPYDDPYKMSQYLLVDTLIYGLTKRSRLGQPEKVKLPGSLFSDMLRILRDEVTNIESKYYEINELLEEYGIELWLLLDEFQQVVERWDAPAWCEFIEMCNLLSSHERNKPDHIKIVCCGSDDLLKHMILKRDSVWKNTFRSTVPVNALLEPYFEKMVKSERAISQTNLEFSDQAISALFHYTGGIALYGKEICSAIFEDIIANPQKWAARNTIYTSDVAEATQKLLSRQNHELSTQAQEGISKIYAAVTKNLDESTDMQLLWYMAKWLYENSQQDGFPESIFTQALLTSNFKSHLNDSLSIAEARGIIRKSTSHYNNETVYGFNTLFYYFAFCGSATKDNLDEELIFAQDEDLLKVESEDDADDPYDFDNIMKIAPGFEKMYSPDQQKTFLGALVFNGDKSVRKIIKELAGTSIDTQNNVQINVQSITNAFATLLSDDVSSENYLAAFSKLPSVQMFIPEENKALLGDRIHELHSAEDEESFREAEGRIEELTTPAEQEMTGIYIAAAVNSTDFFKVTDEQWEELVHISKKELEQHVPPEFITSLGFAVMLHNVFEAIRLNAAGDITAQEKVDTELDYCPVAIMYCKVVEALLKELHTPVYARRLEDKTISPSSGIAFGDLLREDGSVDTSSKNLTIGSFSYHIVKPSNFDEGNDIDHPEDFAYEPKTRVIQKITSVKSYTNAINLEWSQHAVSLAVVQGIRNKSAHEARPITKANFDWLIETLFDEGELLRIAELAKKQYPNNGS